MRANTGNEKHESANTKTTQNTEIANNANTDQDIIEAIANSANTGELVKSAGLRIEISRKRLANGGYLYFGAYRERNKGRKNRSATSAGFAAVAEPLVTVKRLFARGLLYR